MLHLLHCHHCSSSRPCFQCSSAQHGIHLTHGSGKSSRRAKAYCLPRHSLRLPAHVRSQSRGEVLTGLKFWDCIIIHNYSLGKNKKHVCLCLLGSVKQWSWRGHFWHVCESKAFSHRRCDRKTKTAQHVPKPSRGEFYCDMTDFAMSMGIQGHPTPMPPGKPGLIKAFVEGSWWLILKSSLKALFPGGLGCP